MKQQSYRHAIRLVHQPPRHGGHREQARGKATVKSAFHTASLLARCHIVSFSIALPRSSLAKWFLFVCLFLASGVAAAQPCPGDCDSSGGVTQDEVLAGLRIGLAQAALPQCRPADGDNDGLVVIEDLVRSVDRAVTGCARQQRAFVLGSDFQTGSFATVDLASRQVDPTSRERVAGSDAVVRAHHGVIYVLNRFLANSIQAFEADSLRPLFQCSTGAVTNPHDIAVVDAQKAYVTAYESNRLLIVNPTPRADCSDFVTGSIDLSGFADADGVPEMDQMLIVGNRLYVSLEQLDRRNFFEPARNGCIVTIDIETDSVVTYVDLSGTNPFASTKGLVRFNGDIVIAQAGRFGVNDGGIERMHPATNTVSGFFITGAELGGDINDFVLLSEHLGYVALSGPSASKVVAFDPAERRVLRTVYDRGGFVPDIEVNDRGELYVADRAFGQSGLRIYRAADGSELLPGILPIGLPPFDILFQ